MILEAQKWPDNAALIKAMFDMHVWPKKWAQPPNVVTVLDPTYGRGTWWAWCHYKTLSLAGALIIDDVPFIPTPGPLVIVGHDIRRDRVDYRHLPEPDETFDVVTFDPDYIAPGGRETSTIADFNDRYGLKEQYESPESLQDSIGAGIRQCARVLKPQGILMAKCTNYVSSGKLWLGEHHTIQAGLEAGLVVEDIVVHVGGTGPQPDRPNSRQQHVRSNSSRLIVFRKPGRRTKGN